jgi:branched-chain amino acid transport system ATP-binding protein/branched-chain amino acid transport system permease protein
MRKVRGPGGRLDAGTVVLVLAAAALALGIPRMGAYHLYVVALVGTQVIAVLSLNLLMGYAGQVSLGQAAFVGMGAFGAAQFAAWGVPFPLTIVAAGVATAGAAAIVGLPSLRIRGLQLAATTLAFGIMAELLIFARPWDPASTAGVAIARPSIIAGDRPFALVVVATILLVLLIDTRIRRSRLGRAFLAVRDREDTAAARGVPVGRVKLAAYVFSGLYAGIAGALFAYLLESVSATPFSLFASLSYVAAVVIGGLGSWKGAVVAGALLAALPEVGRGPFVTWTPLAGAALLMIVPVLRPDGLAWLLARRFGGGRVPSPEAGEHDQPALRRALAADDRRALPLTMPVRTLLVADDVHVSFGGLHVLRGLSLEVRRGETVGLIGPNGAGKTTFFNCVSGFLRPDAGRLTYRGRDLLTMPNHARAGLGIVRTFQQVGLSSQQTVWQNVLAAQHARAAYGWFPGLLRTPAVARIEADCARRTDVALTVLGLRDVAGARLGGLPHGKQRLTEIAAAVAAGPELLVLDEPGAGMGPDEAAEFAERLDALRGDLGFTVFIIEHHMPLIARLCEYVYALTDGRAMAEGTVEQVQRDPVVVATYLGEAERTIALDEKEAALV